MRSTSAQCRRRRSCGSGLLRYARRRAWRSSARLLPQINQEAPAPPSTQRTGSKPRSPTRLTATVCSHCADRLWSLVTMVQPSASSRMSRLAGVDHRLDREGHARLEHQPGSRPAVVQDLRLLVELVPMPWPQNSRTTEKPCFSAWAWIAEPISPSRAPGRTWRIPSHMHSYVTSHQAARLDARLAHVVHAAGIAVVAVLDHGDVDVQDVAGLQHPVARDAVADLVVHGGADRLRERLVARRRIVEGGRHGAAGPAPCSRGRGRSACRS